MRNFLSLLAAGMIAVAAGSAYAAPDFTATLTLSVGTFDPIAFEGQGIGESVGGGGATLPAGAIVAGFVSRLTDPLLGVIPGFAVCGQGQSTSTFPIPATPGSAGVVFDCDPLTDGVTDEIVYDGVDEAIGGILASAYLTNAASIPLVTIPLDVVGVGGTVNFTVLGSPATLTANPWTTGEVTVTGGLSSGDIVDNPYCTGAAEPFPCCTGAGLGRCDQFNASGADNRDENGLGELRLVTTALVDLGALGSTPSLTELDVIFNAPEPGASAIGFAAFGTLALLSRRARRS
jgi:hypothetical protein